jgi:hypothetical protein
VLGSVGPMVMRTSSAGMAGLAIANHVLGRWELVAARENPPL